MVAPAISFYQYRIVEFLFYVRRDKRKVEENLPGLGTTVSKISKCSFPHPAHKGLGTSQRKTLPSRKMHGEGIISPSRRLIPSLVIDLTCTAGGLSSARMLVNELLRFTELICIPRNCGVNTARFINLCLNEDTVRCSMRGSIVVLQELFEEFCDAFIITCRNYLQLTLT